VRGGPVFGRRALFKRTKLRPWVPVAAHGVELETFLNGERAGENAEEIDLLAPALFPATLAIHHHYRFDCGCDFIGLVLLAGEDHGDVLKIRIIGIKAELGHGLVQRPFFEFDGRLLFLFAAINDQGDY